MAAKFRKGDARNEPIGGAELRHAQANRIFVAILAGLLVATAAATIATSDGLAAPVGAVHTAAQY